MNIVTFTTQELTQFVNSDEYYRLRNVPISKLRAISQINNPRASVDDKILFTAFDNDKVVGYFGVLPDFIYVNNQEEKIGWGSCFWVDESYKSQNVAAGIFLKVIREWKQRLFITNIVPSLEAVYQKTKIFQPTKYKTGFRGYLRFNLADILPPKRSFFQRITYLLKLGDLVGNCFIFIGLKIKGRASLKGIKFEYVNELDTQIMEFVEKHNKNELMQRSKPEFDWICKYPWIVQSTLKDENNARYYFSSSCKRFMYLKVKFMDIENKTVGFLILTIRDNSLTIPYFYGEDKYITEIVKFLYNVMRQLDICMLTVFNEKLATPLFNSHIPFLFKKKITRPYLISKQFPQIEDLWFQDGDGDCVFT